MYNHYLLEVVSRQRREKLMKEASLNRLLKQPKPSSSSGLFDSIRRLFRNAARSMPPSAEPQAIPCVN